MPTDKPTFDYAKWQATDAQVRSPKNNRRLIRGLFLESMTHRTLMKYPPLYTLREQDAWENYHGVWLPSAKQIYLASSDEYEAAKKLVVSVEHWNLLIQADWFLHGNKDPSWTSLTQWREEHRVAEESRAITEIRKKAMEGNVTAMKIWLSHTAPATRGRPSKEEVKGHTKKEAKKDRALEVDRARILELVKK